MIYSQQDPKVLYSDGGEFLPLDTTFRVGIFAHGLIEDKLGFDMVSTDSMETFKKIMSARDGNIVRIEEEAMNEAEMTSGVFIIAWPPDNDPIYEVCGYVVDINDIESINFAEDNAISKDRMQ